MRHAVGRSGSHGCRWVLALRDCRGPRVSGPSPSDERIINCCSGDFLPSLITPTRHCNVYRLAFSPARERGAPKAAEGLTGAPDPAYITSVPVWVPGAVCQWPWSRASPSYQWSSWQRPPSQLAPHPSPPLAGTPMMATRRAAVVVVVPVTAVVPVLVRTPAWVPLVAWAPVMVIHRCRRRRRLGSARRQAERGQGHAASRQRASAQTKQRFLLLVFMPLRIPLGNAHKSLWSVR